MITGWVEIIILKDVINEAKIISLISNHEIIYLKY